MRFCLIKRKARVAVVADHSNTSSPWEANTLFGRRETISRNVNSKGHSTFYAHWRSSVPRQRKRQPPINSTTKLVGTTVPLESRAIGRKICWPLIVRPGRWLLFWHRKSPDLLQIDLSADNIPRSAAQPSLHKDSVLRLVLPTQKHPLLEFVSINREKAHLCGGYPSTITGVKWSSVDVRRSSEFHKLLDYLSFVTFSVWFCVKKVP